MPVEFGAAAARAAPAHLIMIIMMIMTLMEIMIMMMIMTLMGIMIMMMHTRGRLDRAASSTRRITELASGPGSSKALTRPRLQRPASWMK